MTKKQNRPTKPKKTSRSIVFDAALLAKAQTQARRENRSFSNWVNVAVRARFGSEAPALSSGGTGLFPVTSPAVAKVEVAP